MSNTLQHGVRKVKWKKIKIKLYSAKLGIWPTGRHFDNPNLKESSTVPENFQQYY